MTASNFTVLILIRQPVTVEKNSDEVQIFLQSSDMFILCRELPGKSNCFQQMDG